jgi:SPFH domain / Band 7 family
VLFVIVLLGAIGFGIWTAVRRSVIRHSVFLPVDRHYAFRVGIASPDAQGSYQSSQAVGGGRVEAPRSYLKMGTHTFWKRRGVHIVKCTRSQEVVTYWFKDDDQWASVDKGPAMSPIQCSTREGVGVRVALRLRYRIADEDFWLLAIQTPGAYRHLVLGDAVTTVNDIIGRRSVYELGNLFATEGRGALREEIQRALEVKLENRHLELTEVFLGPIAFPKDVAQGFADVVKSGSYSRALEEAARGRAYANLSIQPTLTPEIIALAQAEAPLHAAWTQWSGPNVMDPGQSVRVINLPPPFPPPGGNPAAGSATPAEPPSADEPAS